MNKKNIKVSVIVPVYNVEKYIKKCLDSLVNQTLKDIEVIVINDGSPDNSQEIIDKYKEEYPQKVKAYITENRGLGDARNFGLTKASGEYVGFVDSDDYVELDMYEKLYNEAKKNELDMVICGSYNVNENTGKKNIELDRMLFEDEYKNAFFGRPAAWNKLYKKSIINKINFRSRKWYEDLDYTLKAITNSKKIGYVNEPLYNYLIREGSIMNNKNIDRNLEILDTFDEIKKYNKLKKYNDIVEYLAIYHIYISASVRIITADALKTRQKENLNKLFKYMNTNFENYKNNKYIHLLSKNKKIVYTLLNMKAYWLIKIIFKIKRR